MRLADKVALITGAARGIGASEAHLFASEGARVVIADVATEEAEKVKKQICDLGGEAVIVPLDVTDEEAWQAAVHVTITRFGKIDILVNNAGIFRRIGMEDTSLETWSKVIDINATGVFLGTKAVIPAMRNGGGGAIVNISSVGGIVGIPQNSAYQASKGMVRIFTKATAIEYAADRIRANSIHPGAIETPMVTPLLQDPSYVKAMMDSTPLKRLGKAEDVAYGVLYLASDEATYVTGAELIIDGGMTAQ